MQRTSLPRHAGGVQDERAGASEPILYNRIVVRRIVIDDCRF
jgi:hypothetical protein